MFDENSPRCPECGECNIDNLFILEDTSTANFVQVLCWSCYQLFELEIRPLSP